MLYQEDYSKRKRLREPFLSTRKNVYNQQRVENNVTKQLNNIHGNEIKQWGATSSPSERGKAPFEPVSRQTHMSDEEGLKRAYDSPNRYYQHRNKLFVAGTKDFSTSLFTIYETSPIVIFLLGQNLSATSLQAGITSFAARIFISFVHLLAPSSEYLSTDPLRLFVVPDFIDFTSKHANSSLETVSDG